MTLQYIDEQLKTQFKILSFDTISNIENRKRVNFKNTENELQDLYKEVSNLIIQLFNQNNILIRLTFWNKQEYNPKEYNSNTIDILHKKDSIILLLKFNFFDDQLFNLIKNHLNFELVIASSLNVTSFMLNFNIITLLNIDDDRGSKFIIYSDWDNKILKESRL